MPTPRQNTLDGGPPPTRTTSTTRRPEGREAPERVDILGVPVHRVDRAGARAVVTDLAARPGHDVVAFVNAHASNLAAADPAYREVLHHASLVLNDGVGMGLAARLRGTPFADDLNGTDLLPRLLADLAVAGHSVFFYGAAPGVAARTAEVWSRRLPGLRVAGSLDGFTLSGAAAAEVIRVARADVVLVALGNPRQESWALHVGGRTGARLTVGVGAFFDFSAGVVRRAPRPVRRLRLEWAFRLLQEPRRLARRYLVGNPAFLLRVAVAQVRPVRPLATSADLRRHPSASGSVAFPAASPVASSVVRGPWPGSDHVERAG